MTKRCECVRVTSLRVSERDVECTRPKEGLTEGVECQAQVEQELR